MLFTTGTFIAGGGVVAAAGSESASGSVDTRQLQIPPTEYEGEDGSVVDLTLEVVGNYEFDTGAADTIVLSLAVAPEGEQSNFQPIDETEQSVATASGAGQYTLSGRFSTTTRSTRHSSAPNQRRRSVTTFPSGSCSTSATTARASCRRWPKRGLRCP